MGRKFANILDAECALDLHRHGNAFLN